MATLQGTFSNTAWIGTRLEYNETATDVVNNTSTIHVRYSIVSIDGGYTIGTTSGGTAKIEIGDDVRNITVPNFNISANEVWLLAEYDVVVPHNSDGSKAIWIQSSLDTGIGSSLLYASFTLTTIPRVSSTTCSDFYIESSTTININAASSNFRHTLKYNFGNLSGTIADKTALTSVGWEPDASTFYAQIPDSMYGVGSITCETYNGDTLIGTKTCNFTARVDSAKNKINVGLTVMDVNETTKALTGNSNVLIKYFSNARTIITATPKNSAIIDSYYVNGIKVSQVNTFNNVENNIFMATVKDSRGIESYSSGFQKSMVDYVKLAVKSGTITRTGPTSDQIRMNMEGFCFKGSFGAVDNELNLKIRYKEEYGDWSEYYTATATVTDDNTFNLSDYNLNTLFNNASFDYQKSYTFEFVVTDKLMTLNQTVSLKRGLPTIAFGENFVHVYGDLEVDGDILLKDLKVASVGFCKITSTAESVVSSRTKFNSWKEEGKYSNFNLNSSKGGIEIPKGTNFIQISAMAGGGGNGNFNVYVKEFDTNTEIYNASIIVQPESGGYWRQSICSDIIQLDPTKRYYTELYYGPYNSTRFALNEGFGAYATTMFIKKIL